MLKARIIVAVAVALVMAGAVAAQDKPDALASYRTGRDLETKGDAAGAAKRYDEAVAICFEELRANPKNLESHTVLCWSLLRQKKYQEVVDWGQKGLAIAEDLRIVEVMGEAFFFLNRIQDSLKYLTRYVVALPDGDRTPTAYFYIAECYMRYKKYSHADIAYTLAVKLEPSMPRWWLRLGNARESAGEPRSALVAYEKALSLSPGNAEMAAARDKAVAAIAAADAAAAAAAAAVTAPAATPSASTPPGDSATPAATP